jgi:transformation/transcription domain-associated protein
MLDTVRDTESVRALPYLVPALLEFLRSGSVAFHKDSVEYQFLLSAALLRIIGDDTNARIWAAVKQFRRVLLEIINRLPVNEAIRPSASNIFNCMLHVLRHDNEENGVIACKTLLDSYRPLTDDSLSEFLSIFQEAFKNMSELVEQTLSEDSAVLDPNVMLPGIRSFKVLGELGMVMVIMSQFHRPMVSAPVQTTIPPGFEISTEEG